jgi:hypothetical protein
LAVGVVLAAATACSSGGSSASPNTADTVSATIATNPTVATAPPGAAATSGATTTPLTTAAGTGAERTDHFGMLPVGAKLPSDAECASRVRPTPEVRPANTAANRTPGHGPPANPPTPFYARVTGNFTGTTDEIIQWAACKWGIDEDLVRAQAVKESYWKQDAAGDFGTDPSACVPGHGLGDDPKHPGECPQSIGILQVRYPYWGWAFPDAVSSTAYNLDAALAARRDCFEGNNTWLNTVDRGKDYVAGDIWGCMGLWYSGRWYVPAGIQYTTDVQNTLAQRYWEDSSFINDG